MNLIKLLLEQGQVAENKDGSALRVLDTGCGIGGTSRYLARELGATVTGVTISGKQVEMARRLTKSEAAKHTESTETTSQRDDEFIGLGSAGGKVRFIELDAEKMGEYFASEGGKFDIVWISEALSHFPNKPLFFKNAEKVLKKGGKLVLADWFKSEDVAPEDADIKAIEDGMLLPPLSTQKGYVEMAEGAGLKVLAESKDISQEVSKTW